MLTKCATMLRDNRYLTFLCTVRPIESRVSNRKHVAISVGKTVPLKSSSGGESFIGNARAMNSLYLKKIHTVLFIPQLINKWQEVEMKLISDVVSHSLSLCVWKKTETKTKKKKVRKGG